jgi:hypothetical protein
LALSGIPKTSLPNKMTDFPLTSKCSSGRSSFPGTVNQLAFDEGFNVENEYIVTPNNACTALNFPFGDQNASAGTDVRRLPARRRRKSPTL